MRHKVSGFKLNMNSGGRKALFRSLMVSLIMDEKVVTTTARAKAVKGHVDRLVSKTKKGDLNSARWASSVLANDKAVAKLTGELVKRFENRSSGFTRSFNLGVRAGDNAPRVQIEWVDKAPKIEPKAEKPSATVAVSVPEEPKAEKKKEVKTNVKKINETK